MQDAKVQGRAELWSLQGRQGGLLWAVAVFSFFANLLILAGPIYMLQVYDRVLSSGSRETLLALTVLLVFFFAVMALLDVVRARLLVRLGARFEHALRQRVFDAILRRSALAADPKVANALDDVGAVQRAFASPVTGSLFDLPWTPLFFCLIFLFHPLLGLLAVAGAVAMVALTALNEILSRRRQKAAIRPRQQAEALAQQLRTDAEIVEAMGMRANGFAIWQGHRMQEQTHETAAADIGTGFAAVIRALRLVLQSAMLGLGAWLVLDGAMTAGGMVAGSVLLGRALAPIEMVLNQWPVLQRGRLGWTNLVETLGNVPPPLTQIALPRPDARVVANKVTLAAPGDRQAALRGINFVVEPGQALGVIGPSGAGKTTLARALTGVWPPTLGSITLGGVPLAQYGRDLGQYVGYLPQQVQLFEGTIAQNIARLEPDPDDALVIKAARQAGAHEMILSLPQGYNMPVQSGRARLSGGQLQRIGLARALYRDPVLLVLDEPNSNLDSAGSEALNRAISAAKEQGRAVLIMAHRPAAIQECDLLLVLGQGGATAFGPKEEVLAGMVKNVAALRDPARPMAAAS